MWPSQRSAHRARPQLLPAGHRTGLLPARTGQTRRCGGDRRPARRTGIAGGRARAPRRGEKRRNRGNGGDTATTGDCGGKWAGAERNCGDSVENDSENDEREDQSPPRAGRVSKRNTPGRVSTAIHRCAHRRACFEHSGEFGGHSNEIDSKHAAFATRRH